MEDEVRGWRAAGVDIVVSLLMREEVMELNLEEEEALCRNEDVEFRSLPIPDRGLPPSRASVQKQVAALNDDFNSGKSIAVHCRQGIGRSSVIAALVMISSGVDPDQAFQRIESARGCPVPDTLEQRNWVIQFAAAEAQASQVTVTQAAATDDTSSCQ